MDNRNLKKYPHSEFTKKIIGLAIIIHKTIGPGFPEKFYEKALQMELKKSNLKYSNQKSISIKYNNELLGIQRLDLLVEDKIIVELKTVNEINRAHIAQIISYLKASGLEVGLILNFAQSKLVIKRIIH